ncbi:uncharacterized protein LOC113352875 [Papaver somniferum]|uniref:uncharacterized protein LOC113352875 n=1 Tax=Papaver somniferum TaxID=3469 RepID=UPI000E7031AB|nr:uncharacterized protein LOC113352875 [Papaver somniferum]
MSILQYPESINTSDLQIWNNVAFDDDAETDESIAIKDSSSWYPLQPILMNQSKTLEDFDSLKENRSPVSLISPSAKAVESKGKPLKVLFKQGLLSPSLFVSTDDKNQGNLDGDNVDTEIEEIELEINRLSSKLEALRLEKSEQNLKLIEKPENFQKKIGKNLILANPNSTILRRGVSLGPIEIIANEKSKRRQKTIENPENFQKKNGGNLIAANPNSRIQQRRGVSLGPTEIMASVKSRPPIKPEITPQQSRRKSSVFKLQEINEEKVTTERGGRSLSPVSRRSVLKPRHLKQGFATTGGSKKPVKKDEMFISSIQPKKLFKEGEKFVSPKKNGRVVASRYTQIPGTRYIVTQKQIEQWKKLWPESDKKCASSVGKSPKVVVPATNEGRVKKRWEIPSVVSPTFSILKRAELLPRINTIRCNGVLSPRDSGAAKKVADLEGKKTFFSAESVELDNSVCQALEFDEVL